MQNNPLQELVVAVKNIKPVPELLGMWKAVNLVSFLILLIFPLLMFVFGAPLELSLGGLFLLLVLYLCLVLYIPAFFGTLEYSISQEAVLLRKGVFWKRRTTVPYAKITNIDITQGPVERYYGLSKLHIQTAGASAANNTTAELMMYGIADPEALKDEIMARVLKPASEPVTPIAATGSDPNLLSVILAELRAIRQNIESRG